MDEQDKILEDLIKKAKETEDLDASENQEVATTQGTAKVDNSTKENQYGSYIKYEPRCKICKSNIANVIHNERLQGKKYPEIVRLHPELELNITNLHVHFKKHFKLEQAINDVNTEAEIAKIGQQDIVSEQHLKDTISKRTYSLIETHSALANDIAARIESLKKIVSDLVERSQGQLTAQEIDSVAKVNNQIQKAEGTLSTILQAIDKKMFPTTGNVTINFLQNYIQVLKKVAGRISMVYDSFYKEIIEEPDPSKKDEIAERLKEKLKDAFREARDDLYQTEQSITKRMDPV